jgi:hypothetical protein
VKYDIETLLLFAWSSFAFGIILGVAIGFICAMHIGYKKDDGDVGS